VLAIAYTLYVVMCFPLAQFMALKREGEHRTLKWIASLMIAMWLACPFYVKACLKGLFTNRSYFFRTYKTGKITALLEEFQGVGPLKELVLEPYVKGGFLAGFTPGNMMNFLTWNWMF